MESLDHIRDEILRLVKQAASLDALARARVAILGRKGRITDTPTRTVFVTPGSFNASPLAHPTYGATSSTPHSLAS